MIDGLAWLALEVKYLDRATAFYKQHLDLPERRADDREVAFGAGESALVLRRPAGVPRGGLHTHFAFSIPAGAYDDWWDRLSDRFALEEHRFGSSRSLYFDDPDGHCVELGERDDVGQDADDIGQDADDVGQDADDDADGTGGVTGIFEIVFEVEDLDAATTFYTDLGFEVVSGGDDDRPRTRLTAGSFDVELWEPHLGLANARGGVHLDVGLSAPDPGSMADRVADRALATDEVRDGVRVKDPDGHYLTFTRGARSR